MSRDGKKKSRQPVDNRSNAVTCTTIALSVYTANDGIGVIHEWWLMCPELVSVSV